jgi:hypothetical protein
MHLHRRPSTVGILRSLSPADGPQVENNSTLNRISEHTALKGRKRADVPVYLWVLAFITPGPVQRAPRH